MNESLKTGVGLLAALLAVGAIVYVVLPHTHLPTRERAYRWVPMNAVAVAELHIEGSDLSPFDDLLENHGIPVRSSTSGPCSILRRLYEVDVWLPSTQGGEFGVVATGDVTNEQVWECARYTIEQRGGRATRRRQGHLTIIGDATAPDGAEGLAVWNQGKAFVLGTKALQQQMLNVRMHLSPSLAGSSVHMSLGRLLTTPKTVLTATSLMTPWLKSHLSMLAGSALSNEIDSVKGIGLAIAFDGTTSHVGLALLCQSHRPCERLTDTLRTRLRLIAAVSPKRLGAWGPMMGKLATSSVPKNVPAGLLTMAVPTERLVGALSARTSSTMFAPRRPMPQHPSTPGAHSSTATAGSSSAASPSVSTPPPAPRASASGASSATAHGSR